MTPNQTTAPANLPAKVAPGPTGISRITDAHQITDLAEPEYDGPPLIGNIDLNTPEGRRLFMKKASQADLDPARMQGQIFKLWAFVAERSVVKDQNTGDLKLVPRIVLFDDAGRTIITSAWSIAHFLQTFIQVYRNGPWNPPIPIVISPDRDRRGNAVYKVEVWEGQTP